MRIKMYSVREDEQPFIQAFAKKNNIEIDTVTYDLEFDTVDEVKGYDGISILQTADMDDERVYKKLNEFGIKQISLRSAGYDMVNIPFANKYDITVTNIPAYSPHAIAEHALMLSMYQIRNMPLSQNRIKQQDFTWPGLISNEISDLVVGVIGVGRIGSVYAKIMNALGAKVIGYDIKVNEENKSFVNYVDSLEDLVKQADLISMHVPLTELTINMINKDIFKQMKDGVIIVNTSRGQAINTKDLIDAIDNNKVKSAGIDVVDHEAAYFAHNYQNKEIVDESVKLVLDHPKIFVTPHIAFYTHRAVENMVNICLDSVVDIINNKKPYTIIESQRK
ncbi:D-2-hydroxyacid dehydrogenase [Mycoplasma sp. P36-A1]|uniref:D-2-hydroxyacid dehydrogenase n=1 Tax=Mycoplasma sp. P36-A1 TaxID=3252900 RepID=UPI003C2AC9DF